MTDLTIILTAHAETLVAGPTIGSLRDAISELSIDGFEFEILVGFDKASQECREYVGKAICYNFAGARFFNFDFGDQGASRNSLVDQAVGRYTAIVDADDLVSENWFRNSVRLMESYGGEASRVVAHPELNWQFDGISNINANPPQDDPFFSPHVMAIANYYDAMCIAPTSAWRELRYPRRDLCAGFALEDYQWFVGLTEMGWRHVVVPDTIIFKRRRDRSQHRNSRAADALIRQTSGLSVDRIKSLGRELENSDV